MKKYIKLYALPLSIVLIGIASYFIFLYYAHPVIHSQQEVAKIEDKIKNAKQEIAVVDVNTSKKSAQAQKEETQSDDIQEIEEIKEVALSHIVEDSIIEEPVSIKNKKCYEVVVSALNVREAPTTSSDVIEKYYEGDIVCENERAGDWMLADFGWIYAKGFVEPLQESSDFDEVVDEQVALIEEVKEENKSTPQNTLTLESKKIDHDAKIQNLTKRYNNSPSYELALDVAKLYLNVKNYKEASKWALIANEHNSKKEDSWVIFAKSLDAQGKKGEAIKILKTYLETNPDATKAVITLERLER